MQFTEVRLFNGNIYALTKLGDIFQIAHGPTNLPEITMLSHGGSGGVNVWPDWLLNVPRAISDTTS